MNNLYPYQEEGVQWLLSVKRGILADDQGLGKTVMAAVACDRIGRDFHAGLHIGIVCNSSNISSWANHMCEWYAPGVVWNDKERGRSTILHHDRGSRTEIVNYDNISGLGGCPLDILIVDEAHHIRNRKTNAFRYLKVIAKNTKYLFLLTASPTVNVDQDMWTLLHLCNPVRFRSYWKYIFKFFDVSTTYFGLKIDNVRESEEEGLHKLLSEYMLHRGESVIQLPDILRKRVDYTLNYDHRLLYNEMEEEWVARLGDKSISAPVKVAQVTRLRQLAISPKLLFKDYTERDKIDRLIEMLDPNINTVVFTAFEQAAVLLCKRLEESGLSCAALTGKTRNRDEIVNRFGQDFPVLVITHKTGGESLTLTQARRAIFLDLAWHQAGNRHALKRIHRIGQDEEVTIFSIRSVGTIEEHIEDIIRTKGKMSVNDLIARMKREI